MAINLPQKISLTMTHSSPETQYFHNAADYFDMLCFTQGHADHLPTPQVLAY